MQCVYFLSIWHQNRTKIFAPFLMSTTLQIQLLLDETKIFDIKVFLLSFSRFQRSLLQCHKSMSIACYNMCGIKTKPWNYLLHYFVTVFKTHQEFWFVMNLDLNLVENLTDWFTSRMHAFALIQLQSMDSQICKKSKSLKFGIFIRDTLKIKRIYLGIFPKRRTPPPPPFGNPRKF